MVQHKHLFDNYIKKTDKTVSPAKECQPRFTEGNILYLKVCLNQCIRYGMELDKLKKFLFYGKGENSHSYQKLSKQIPLTLEQIDLIHGIIGAHTETVELLQELLQSIKDNGTIEDLDRKNLKEELGDLFWYVARIVKIGGFRFPDILKANWRKLLIRYRNKRFTESEAINRDTGLEKKVISGKE